MTDVDTAGQGVTDALLEKIGSFGLGTNPAAKVWPFTIHPVRWRPLTSLKPKEAESKKAEDSEVREATSSEECKQRLEAFIKKKGLEKFYPQVTEELSKKAAKLVNELRDQKKCTWEMANQFVFLALYDLAILIGTNFSSSFWDQSIDYMGIEQMTPTPWYTTKRVLV